MAPGGTPAYEVQNRPEARVNRNPMVDAWFEVYDNPQKANVQRVREIVLGADPRVVESA